MFPYLSPLAILEAQHEMACHLRDWGINCPQTVLTVEGSIMSLVALDNNNGLNNAVRLTTFIPGIVLDQVHLTPKLCFKLGQYIGQLDNKLQVKPSAIYIQC